MRVQPDIMGDGRGPRPESETVPVLECNERRETRSSALAGGCRMFPRKQAARLSALDTSLAISH